MTTRTVPTTRRLLASVLAMLSFASVLVEPALEAVDGRNGPVLESEHDPTRCVRGHDHTICTQVRASARVATDRVRHGLTLIALPFARSERREDRAPAVPHVPSLGSRAPPA